MVKKTKISGNVIRRLPRYLRKLEELSDCGVDKISSGELGSQMGLTPSQIRQDFSCFGEFGQQGYGYNVMLLRDEMATILGTKREFTVILIGVGNLGHALIENFGFSRLGFTLLSAFDINPQITGTDLSGIKIRSVSEISGFIANNKTDIAVLTVPRHAAQEVAETVVQSGIRAIWNFANIELDLKNPEVLVENIHFSDSLLALSYYLSDALFGGS